LKNICVKKDRFTLWAVDTIIVFLTAYARQAKDRYLRANVMILLISDTVLKDNKNAGTISWR
jgi:hypothetical protein